MQKLYITSLLIVGAGYFGFLAFKDKITGAAKTFVKENLSVRLSGFKIHRIDLKGIEVYITLDLINLSSVTAKAENIQAQLFYLKNGSPSPLAITTIQSPFTIAPKDTTRVRDVKITVPTMNILYNMGVLSDANAQFRIVVSAKVNGSSINVSQEFSRNESN